MEGKLYLAGFVVPSLTACSTRLLTVPRSCLCGTKRRGRSVVAIVPPTKPRRLIEALPCEIGVPRPVSSVLMGLSRRDVGSLNIVDQLMYGSGIERSQVVHLR